MNFTIINQALSANVDFYDFIFVEIYLKLKALVCYLGGNFALEIFQHFPFLRILF